MAFEAKKYLTRIKRQFTVRMALAVAIIALVSNLNALIDLFLHPEISYFDAEHVIVGGATGIIVALLLGVVELYVRRYGETERNLKKELAKAQSYFDVAGVIMVALDTAGNIILLNRQGCDILGCTGKTVTGSNWFDLFIPDRDREIVKAVFSRLMKGEIDPVEYYENPVVTMEGEERIIAWHNSVLSDEGGAIIGTLSSGMDISERRQAEETLRTSEEKYRDLFENATDAIFLVDAEMRYVDVNRKAIELFGYTNEEWLTMSVLDVIPREQASRSKQEFEKLRTEGLYEKFVGKMFKKDGTDLDVEVSSSAIYDDGRFIGSRDIVRDITERKGMEEDLRNSEKRYRLLFETNPQPMLVYDVYTLGILAVNEAAVTKYGYLREEFLSMTIKDIRPPEDVPALLHHLAKPSPELDIVPGVWRHRKKDGTILFVEITSHKLTFGGRPAELVLAYDVSERKRLEDELLKARKLESLGVLAGGIAHDFNNLLVAVLGNIDMAKLGGKAKGGITKWLDAAEKATLRARDLTQQLLTFSRGGEPVRKTTSLKSLISDSVQFAVSGSNVQVAFHIVDDLWPSNVDEGQISQVINNLIINADQAMKNGGMIDVTAENRTVSGDRELAFTAGDYIKVSIRDEGDGIPAESLQNIFDPYFTTKAQGSGLGLATSYSIVKKHDGYITVESEEGSGTTFSVYLPAQPHGVLPAEQEDRRPLFGTGRVLIMDDEESVSEITAQMLTRLGYEVEIARDGAEAIERYVTSRKQQKPFDVVIMDLTIPGGMGGKEAIQKLREIDPDVRAIVSSGYSNDPVMADYSRYGFTAVAAKPYKIHDLSRIIYDILTAGTV